jgi:4-diphosphocytidyl-2-C-methyl-D-erythritol kinase
MVVFSNAKLNLGLFVTEKRADGFHNLESLFVPIPLSDILEIIPAKEFKLTVSGLSFPGEITDNIVFKAWNLLHENHNCPAVHVFLRKMIPNGAGMGGGSSNGAFMLKALNELFFLQLDQELLGKYAAELGSDCPFFLHNEPALVQGRGEVLSAVDIHFKNCWLVLVKPTFSVSTKEAFSGIVPKASGMNWKSFLLNPDLHWNQLRNDFESTVFQVHPDLLEIKSKLIEYNPFFCSMTGTGSTIFALYEKEPHVSEALFKGCFFWKGRYNFTPQLLPLS